MSDAKFGGNDRGLRNDMNGIANRHNKKRKVIIRRIRGVKVATYAFYAKPKRDYKL